MESKDCLKLQRKETEDRLIALIQEKRSYDEELYKREEMIRNTIDSEASEEYRELERHQDLLSQQLLPPGYYVQSLARLRLYYIPATLNKT